MVSEDQISDFLKRAGWQQAKRSPLAGDASSRRYDRLCDPKLGRAILMSDPDGRVQDFRQIGLWLRQSGFSAPEEIACDEAAGLLVLEDFGDDLFTSLIAKDQTQEKPLLAAAVDVLAALSEVAPPATLMPIQPTYLELASSAWSWYQFGTKGDLGNHDEALAHLSAHLAAMSAPSERFLHRDWHAGNLIWLGKREGIKRTGILDFQSALTGHLGYDLVSMTRDARRAVPDDLHHALVNRFANRTGLSPATFARDCAVLAVQRNLRVLGIFARLSLRFGKPHYVDYIPVLWLHLQNDLAHPALGDLRKAVLLTLPEPTSLVLEQLKARCGTLPTL